MTNVPKKTPKDASEFEREQLRFLLTSGDLSTSLATINPSLAWLPFLAEIKAFDSATKLAPWIEMNFADVEAISEVAENVRFFGPDTADLLEFRLNRMTSLPELLTKSWRLIILYMRQNQRGKLRNEWFEIEPRIRRGEHSAELLKRTVDTLTPRLEISGCRRWFSEEEIPEPKFPSDLMSIDYEVENGLTEDEVLEAWPVGASAEVDSELIKLLTQSLGSTILEAIEALTK